VGVRRRLQPPASARSVCAVAWRQHAHAELCVAARGGRSWDQPRRAAFDRRPAPRPRQSLFFAPDASGLLRYGLSDAGVPPPRRLALVFAGRAAARKMDHEILQQAQALMQLEL